jgi:crotonobetainyl-CoA:carnitine CoA-transferase CaiB-like acyl-CoA transferase
VLALAVGNDLQFRNMCLQVLERPDLWADERYQKNRDRVMNRASLIPSLAEMFLTRRTAEWIVLLKQAGVPAGQVRKVSEVFSSPEVAEREIVTEVPDERHGTLRLTASPLRLSGTPVRPAKAPPRLGEHTSDVLKRELGLSEEQIGRIAVPS